MPENTATPIEWRISAPAPLDNTSGTRPMMNAKDVIRIGRRRNRLASTAASTPVAAPASEDSEKSTSGTFIGLGIVVAAILGVGAVAPDSFMGHFTVFVLAIFVGWQVIWNVTPALHTPLMSVTNAISGIIVVGALLQMSSTSTTVTVLAAIALFVASINIFGGFWVTQRMLRMFRKDL